MTKKKKKMFASSELFIRVEPGRIANKISTFQENRKTLVPWVKEAHQDLKVLNQRRCEQQRSFKRETKENQKGVIERRMSKSKQRMKEYRQMRKEL